MPLRFRNTAHVSTELGYTYVLQSAQSGTGAKEPRHMKFNWEHIYSMKQIRFQSCETKPAILGYLNNTTERKLIKPILRTNIDSTQI